MKLFELAIVWPIHLEYLSGWAALLLFLGLGAVIVVLGMRSLNGLGAVRKWMAIGIRLTVLLLFILILGGIRWQRVHKDLEVMALVDVSGSMRYFDRYPGHPSKPLREAEDEWIMSLAKEEDKQPDDKIGVISFKQNALIDLMPSKEPRLDTHSIPDPGTGTDAGSAIQLALASLSKDAMHRLVLFWDGNDTTGNLDAALDAAAAQHVQIDVVPLHYDVKNAAMIDRFVAPAWKREDEPFSLSIILTSTADHPVTGKLTVMHETSGGREPLDMDLSTPEVDPARQITLQPGKNVQYVKVPALKQAGAHQFHAVFTADATGEKSAVEINNTADAFTFVQGEGKVLYVDNVLDQNGNRGPGDELAKALIGEKIHVQHVTTDGIPTGAVALQDYDAVVMANVPRGAGGVGDEQDKMFQSYVHDMGGGLIMIGGDQAFGAGGWQGSAVEKILPVDMDIPAQRQIGKGALVLIMHSCEFPNGNYWGLECALKAVEALSSRDEVGIITYSWGGGGFNGGGSQWDLPLAEKGDGSAAVAAAKKMQPGDMPSFDDCLNVALNGGKGSPKGLAQSDAQFKHVIIISDGDPSPPMQNIYDAYVKAKVSVSTVSVYPHGGGVGPTMEEIAKTLNGRSYGPINGDFNQLPKIFIKEATVVRRTLIHTDAQGIPLQLIDPSDEFIKGLSGFPDVYGMVLTSRKNDPKVVMPIAAGKLHDPIMAHWQTGLGRSAVFTSDASAIWASQWLGSPLYSKFWAQMVRGVSRPPMSSDFDIQTSIVGDKGKIVVEAVGKNDKYLNFLNIEGKVLGPDMKNGDVKLVPTGPGTYEATFDAKTAGNYVVGLQYSGKDGSGVLRSGAAMNTEPEYRELKSNDRLLNEIAARTNGHIIQAFDSAGADLFRREGLLVTSSPLPIWDQLLPWLLALIIVDVATRRIAWDWASTKKIAGAMAARVQAFTTLRRVENAQTLDALKRVREEVAETKFKPAEKTVGGEAARPDPKAKFSAPTGVEGDITQVVGGATDKPMPPLPKKVEPKGAPAPGPGGHTGSLLEAKRRAQQQIRKKEEGE